MQGRPWILILGTALGALVAVPLTVFASSGRLFSGGDESMPSMMGTMVGSGMMGSSRPDQQTHERESVPGDPHEGMHRMMDAMMGAGSSDRMHANMPGSEEMMDRCVQSMGGVDDGMMRSDGTKGMMR